MGIQASGGPGRAQKPRVRVRLGGCRASATLAADVCADWWVLKSFEHHPREQLKISSQYKAAGSPYQLSTVGSLEETYLPSVD